MDSKPQAPQVDFEAFSREFNIKAEKFINSIDGLSKNEVIRVLKALTLFPLEHEKIKLSHREEVAAFNLGTDIFTTKMNMTMAYIGEHSVKGTEMINEAEGDTPEKKVENAIKTSKKVAEVEDLKEKVEESQKEIVKDVPKVVAEIIKPKKKAEKKDE